MEASMTLVVLVAANLLAYLFVLYLVQRLRSLRRLKERVTDRGS